MIKKSLLLMLLMALLAPWAAKAQETLTVYNGTDNNNYVPFYGLYADEGVKCEFVIPADSLEDMTGGTISAMKFYLKSVGSTTITPTFIVFVKEVDVTTLTALTGTTGATTVFNDAITFTKNTSEVEVDIPFSSGYSYGGGNLLIGVYQDAALGSPNYSQTTWYGVTQTYNSAWSGNETGSGRKFLPKTTFTYTPNANYCARPTNLHIVGEVGPRSATVGWDAETGEQFQYALVSGHNIDPTTVTTFDGTTSSNEMSWSTLTPDSDYTVVLRKVCGTDNYSQAISLEFHTTVACPAPTLALTANSETAHGATVNWTGFSDSYILELGTIASTSTITVLDEGFEGGSMPEGWDNTIYSSSNNKTWTVGVGSGYSTTSGTTTAATGNYNACYKGSNPYSQSAYLITPAMNLANASEATLSFNYTNPDWGGGYFDLTIYYRVNEGTWNQLDKYTTSQTGWTSKTVPLTGFANNYQIAFYVTGHPSDYGYGVGIDDVKVVAEAVAYNWTTASNNATSPYIFNNLDPETTYFVRVTGVCGNDQSNPSETVSFTTNPSCLAPTNLAANNVTAHTASLSWTANNGESVWKLYWKKSSDANYTEVPVGVSNPYPLTNLDGDEAYEFYVVADCGGGDESDPSSVCNFTTPVACPAPTTLTCDNSTITSNSATLSWTENGSATAWQICLNGDENNPIAVDDSELVQGSYTLSGLTAATNYTAKVRANCGGIDGTSAWSNQVSFTTSCPDSYPLNYTCGFEGPNTTGSNPMPMCWTRMGSHTNYPNVSTSQHHGEGTRSLSFYKSSSSTYNNEIAALPAIDAEMNTVRVVFYGKLSSASTDGTINVGYVTSLTDATTFQSVETVTLTTDWEKYTISFSNVGNVSGNIAFQALYSTAYAYIYIDDVLVEEIPSCLEPSNLQGTANALTATITWESEAAKWQVAHATSATAEPNDNIVDLVSAKTFTMDNQPLGDHYFWVRTYCSATDQSSWTGPVSVHIGYCLPAPTSVDGNGISNVTFGIGNNIVNNDTPKATYTDCTSQIGAVQAGVEATVSITYAHTYDYGTFIWVDLNNDLDFEDEGEILYYGMSAGSTNPHTLSATITIPASQTPGDYVMRIGGADSGFNSASSADPCYTGTYACFQDYTLRVLAAPTCYMPTGLTASNPGPHSVKLSWTAGASETAWDICVDGDEVNLIPVVETDFENGIYTLTGLTAETLHTVKVRANCGVDDGVSVWSSETSFTTDVACPAPTLLPASNVTNNSAQISWTGSEATDFNVRTASINPVFFEDFESGIPNTWTTIDADADGNNWLALSEISTVYSAGYSSADLSGWAHSGSNAASSPSYYNSGNNSGVSLDSDHWLISPQVSLGGILKFYVSSTYSDLDSYEVLLSTTGTATTDFTVTLQAMKEAPYDDVNDAQIWEEVVVDLGSYANQQGYIAIHHVSDAMYFLVVDDFGIYNISWQTTSASGDHVILTNLTDETEYEVQVQAVCGGQDGSSDWSSSLTFETLSNCSAPDELSETNITANSATLNWTGAQDSYNVRYRKLTEGEIVSTTEDFSGQTAVAYNATGGELPANWYSYTTGTYAPRVSNSNSYSYISALTGNYLLMTTTATGQSVYAIMPQYNNIAAVSFNYSFESASSCGTIEVGYVTDNTSYGTFQRLGDAIAPATGLHSYTLSSSDISTINANGGFIAFKYNSNSSTYYSAAIDNVVVTTQSFTPAAWNETNTRVTSPLPISGLEMGTLYEWQVQGINASCNDGEGNSGVTEWSAMGSFRTPFTKTISGYGTGNGKWCFIASPVTTTITPSSENGFVADPIENFDLYRFNQSATLQWENWKSDGNHYHFNLESGRGYLYANANDVTLTFTGVPYSGNGEVSLTYDESLSDTFKGWNLVGNPFGQTAYPDRAFYMMNADGNGFTAANANSPVSAMEGIFVRANSSDDKVTFSKNDPSSSKGNINIVLTKTGTRGNAIDNAIVSFNSSNKLDKFYFGRQNANISIAQYGEEYAIVSAEAQGETPVNFKAAENGEYTLTVNPENVVMGYLHLIDTKTNDDIDLMANPSYTFNANSGDNSARFRLVFKATGIDETNTGDSFAFISNGEIILTNVDSNSVIQVVDMLGRTIGTYNANDRISTENMSAGVYVLRLIEGSSSRNQKIVVK